MRTILLILDSVGIASAPDAESYGDSGAATLPHIAKAVGNLHIPTLQRLGLGNIPELIPNGERILGCPPHQNPLASYGVLEEKSAGKDTITGHWEMAGLELNPGFKLFPHTIPAFPQSLIENLEQETGRKLIGCKHAGGTGIMDELGEEHMKSGALICYTSADSVFQIEAHTDIIPLEELYRACEIARKLCDPLRIGRVIARPFNGTPGNFERTPERRDYAYQPEELFVTEYLAQANIPVYAVGKIEDIILKRGIEESIHSGHTKDSQVALEKFIRTKKTGFIWANFIDFDMLYGHRRDPEGYARALMQTDRWLNKFLDQLGDEDILMITADHGNDPTYMGSDHTRELVPLLVYGSRKPRSLGYRKGFYDIAQTIASIFGINPMRRGKNFLSGNSNPAG